MQRIQNSETVVLGNYLVGTYFKFIVVIFCPPIAQCAVAVILAAFVIKTMRHFVADNGADSTIIHSIIRTKIKKRKLQNTGGERNFIIGWAVGCINSRWRH